MNDTDGVKRVEVAHQSAKERDEGREIKRTPELGCHARNEREEEVSEIERAKVSVGYCKSCERLPLNEGQEAHFQPSFSLTKSKLTIPFKPKPPNTFSMITSFCASIASKRSSRRRG